MTEIDQANEILKSARELFETRPDWVFFFRTVLGVGGAVRRNYRTREALAEFERTDAYRDIQKMLAKLREPPPEKEEPEDEDSEEGDAEPLAAEASPEPEKKPKVTKPNQERIKVITVRLPMSVHDALKEEAHAHKTSVNQLCISKLVQLIDNEFIPVGV
jgi:hypothetical protein